MAEMRPIRFIDNSLSADFPVRYDPLAIVTGAQALRREYASKRQQATLHFLAAPFAALKRWYQKQVATAELMSLDDRLLKDIGLNRGDIPKVVSGEYFTDRSLARVQEARS